MRVLYFHQHFTTPEGSSGSRSYEFARALVSAGHQVTVVCGSFAVGDSGLEGGFENGQRRGNVDGIDVIELALPYSNKMGFMQRTAVFLRYAWRSVLVALSHDCDIVFSTSTPLTAGIPGIFARVFRGLPHVFEVRDLWPELPQAMGVITNPVVLLLMSWLEWLSYRSARHVIGLSPGIVDGIARRGIPRERISLIPNGCDMAEMADGVKAEKFTAVFAGAHGRANGLDALIDVARVIKRNQISGIELLLIGDGSEKSRLMALASAEALDALTFRDPIAKRQLFSLLPQCHVGIMCLDNVPAFYRGTSPNKFFDYLALGLPVINNYPGWLAELVADSDCGVVVPPEDAEAFVSALVALRDAPEDLARKADNARRLGREQFARADLAQRFIAVLEQAAAKDSYRA